MNTNNEKVKIFDSVFKTMCKKMPKLLVPVINELFRTDYRQDELVALVNDEHIKLNLKPIDTYSCIKICNRYYHIECQINPDGEMVIRMLEYDFFIALEKNRKLKDKDVKEDVISMGGTILEFEHDKIYQEGISQGEGLGETKGMFKAVYTLETKGYNEETACDMVDVELEDYRKFKEKNKLELKKMEIGLKPQGPKR